MAKAEDMAHLVREGRREAARLVREEIVEDDVRLEDRPRRRAQLWRPVGDRARDTRRIATQDIARIVEPDLVHTVVNRPARASGAVTEVADADGRLDTVPRGGSLDDRLTELRLTQPRRVTGGE